MPVKRIISNMVAPESEELEDRLVQEWRSPHDEATEPIIIERSDERHLHPTHLYVIWDAWAGVDEFIRSMTIMQAYEKVRGRDMVLYVTVAEGFTFEEARRAGIKYE